MRCSATIFGLNAVTRAQARPEEMTMANAQDGSATIYQFPQRGRFAVSAAREEVKTAAVVAPRVVFGSGWYHDEAIEAERTRKN